MFPHIFSSSSFLEQYTLGLLLVYPFSAIMYHLPNRNLKHFFSFFVGFALVQWIFGADWIHTFVSSIVTYLICLVAPAKHQAKIAFWWMMGYMTAAHAYRMYVSYLSGAFDFTGTQMVLTMKLTSLAYNYYDGTYDHKNVFNPNPPEKEARTYADRRKYALTKLPNLLEFLGYVYCFTCILAGPAFEYSDYQAAIDGSAYVIPSKDAEKKEKKVVKPGNLFPALQRLIVGLICMGIYLYFQGNVGRVSDHYNPEYIATYPNNFYRFFLVCAALTGDRGKFYFAWKVAEGASILAGFGFEGYTPEGKVKGWRGVENMDIVTFETAPSIQTQAKCWNRRTQGWLDRYTYSRANKSLVAVYFVSALWHGLYPGFFIMFFTLPISNNIERLMRAKINPLIIPGYDARKPETYPKTAVATIYYYMSVIFTSLALNYAAIVFCMCSLERSHRALGSFYYAGHILLIGLYILLELFPSPKSAKKRE